MPADFDNPWKEALEKFFQPLIELCFPEIAAAVDWTIAPEFLETELHEVLRGAAVGRQQVDKLVRVHLRNGQTRKILVHVEVQHWPEPKFPERLYSYHVRLNEKGEPVVTAAILADTRPDWRPARYERALLGCRVVFDFPICKLLDLLSDQEALERSQSPSAVLVLANWAAQQTGEDAPERYRWKLRLMRSLYQKGFGRDEIVELYRFLDWVLELPKPLEQEFREEILRTEEQGMPYVTSIERLAKEEGREEGREMGREEGREQGREQGREMGREQGLEEGREQGLVEATRELIKDTLLVRFGNLPSQVADQINSLSDLQRLKQLHRRAIICESLDDFSPE